MVFKKHAEVIADISVPNRIEIIDFYFKWLLSFVLLVNDLVKTNSITSLKSLDLSNNP